MAPDRAHPAALDPERLLAACDATRTRRSGPGGQNRNKVETAVILRHRPTGIQAEANERLAAMLDRIDRYRLRERLVALAAEARLG